MNIISRSWRTKLPNKMKCQWVTSARWKCKLSFVTKEESLIAVRDRKTTMKVNGLTFMLGNSLSSSISFMFSLLQKPIGANCSSANEIFNRIIRNTNNWREKARARCPRPIPEEKKERNISQFCFLFHNFV